MASKDAIVVVLDVSPSMTEKLETAKKAISSLIQSKMLAGKTNEVGIVLCGTDETSNPLAEAEGGYENITQFALLDRPNVELLRRLGSPELAPGARPGDLIEGLIVGLDVLRARTAKKKYNRKLHLITDGMNPVEGAEDLGAVVQMMNDLQVELTVLGVGFQNGTTRSKAVKQESQDEREGEVQYENEKMLISVARATGGQVVPSSDLKGMLAGLNVKKTNPRKLKIPLQLTEELTIPCQYFAKTSQARAPSLAKESRKSFDPTDPASGKVVQDRSYRDPDDPETEVEMEFRIKGYKYGRDYIPVTEDVLESMKMASDGASMRILGFADPSVAPRCYFMSNTKVVIGETGDDGAATAVSALCQAMTKARKLAVARFVRQRNADPEIGVLFPDRGCKGYDRLLYQQLPFEDDLRPFQFPSFDGLRPGLAPTPFQRDAAGALVDRLLLARGGTDLLDLGAVFNPALQRVNSAMIARALDPKCELPEPDKDVEAAIKPNTELLIHAKEEMKRFSVAFDFKKVEKKTAGKKRKAFWSDLEEATATGGGEEEGGGTGGAAETKAGEADAGAAPPAAAAARKEVGTVTPVEDFEALVKDEGGPAGPSGAAEQLQGVVHRLVTGGASAAYYRKALACAKALRAAAAAHPGQAAGFNAFLEGLKAKYREGAQARFWQTVVEAGLTLISAAEAAGGEGGATAEAAAAFLQEEAPAPAPAPAEGPAGEDDDLFDDMA